MTKQDRDYTLTDFFYDLPEEKIAQHPLSTRDASKLLVLDRGQMIDSRFAAFPNWLRPGDCLVINDTKVIPARLIGQRDGGAVAEVLLLKRRNLDTWEALCKPGKKLKQGAHVHFSDALSCTVEDRLEDGVRLVRFKFDGVFETILDELGETPLPPYIKEKLEERSRYQTVYATYDGSAAAPTAGLHFTPHMLKAIQEMGVKLAPLTLHVGLGTFRPVRVHDLSEHHMHEEHFIFPQKTAEIIVDTRASGGRIVAVGTTSARVLETIAERQPLDQLSEAEGDSRIFIRPGFTFKLTDMLLTNFHLPESTLLMMIAAFYGYDRVMEAYRHAVKSDYRFFSFGDAMLLIPDHTR